jgi:hypothetical protein
VNQTFNLALAFGGGLARPTSGIWHRVPQQGNQVLQISFEWIHRQILPECATT